MTRVFLSAGEISGDRYGAALVSALKDEYAQKKLAPPVFCGMGGDNMRAAGVDVRWDVTDISTIGLIEPITYLPRFWRTYREIKAYLKENRPDMIIPIDFQGFNLAICRAAKALGIPVIYYIGPQFWQWGSLSGAKSYLALNHRLLTIFEEEHAYYLEMGAKPIYIGHPLLDLLPISSRHIAMPKEQISLGLFPGSRPQEMTHVAPILMAAAKRLQRRLEAGGHDVLLTVSVSHPRYAERLQGLARDAGLLNCQFVSGVPATFLETCDLALSTSGTMTLELALSGVPLVSIYRLNPVSYWLVKWVAGKKFEAMGHFSLPNLMLKTRLVPEFLQDEATPEAIAMAAEKLLTNGEAHATIQAGYAKLRECLGSGGATTQAASEIFQCLQVQNKG